MVGNDPTTSRLSAERSNHLSYIPICCDGRNRTYFAIDAHIISVVPKPSSPDTIYYISYHIRKVKPY